MRASRLLSILLRLQARGHMTARQLADDLEVSVRTIYRDAAALQSAGIPLVGDDGPGGGYSLLDGYRTRLTGLTEGEARGLFLTGLSGPAAELGLGAAVASAQLKLSASLPPQLVGAAELVRERFHLDPVGWYASPDSVPHLGALAAAVWEQRMVRVRYRRWKDPDEVERTLEPHGIVLKAGQWYLVAGCNGCLRTYRVSQVLELTVLDQRLERVPGFSLPRYWARYLEEFHARLYQEEATIRVTPAGRERLRSLLPAPMADGAERTAGRPDREGRVCATVPVESLAQAERDLLRLGADVEVLAPPQLRRRLAVTARRLARLYRGERPTGV